MVNDRPRFAIQIGPYDSPAALADYGRHIEQLGYDEFYTADHIGPASAAWSRPDPFIPLMVIAAATSLRVGTLVLNMGFYNPALLARTAATIDRFTDGRFVLGVGAGYAADEHTGIGAPILGPGPRVERLAESLEILHGLLDENAVSFDGRYVSAHLDALGVTPTSDSVPILIGGNGRRMVELGGTYADIFQFTGLVHDRDGSISGDGFAPESVDQRARWLTEDAGERNPHIVRSALVQHTSIGGDADRDEEVATHFDLDPASVEDCPFVLNGSVDQVVDKIGRMRERFGISHWVVRDADGFAPIVDACS